MARVLILHDESIHKRLLAGICECEGHEIVAAVDTVEEALAVLRSSLRPLVAILERDHSSLHPELPLFPTIYQNPESYRHHRYIAIHCWELSEEEQALLDELQVIVFSSPYHTEALMEAVAQSAALLPH